MAATRRPFLYIYNPNPANQWFRNSSMGVSFTLDDAVIASENRRNVVLARGRAELLDIASRWQGGV